MPPDNLDSSSPSVSLSLHPCGGFCAVSTILPLPRDTGSTEIRTHEVSGNGLNPKFGFHAHCLAAEPDATFLRIAVIDRYQEVAYESAVLGRIKCGYRVLQMRSMLGTRIERNAAAT